MEITKQLILRFLTNNCSAEEATQVADYLASNPAILDEFLSEQEWEQFETNDHVPAAMDQEMFATIQQQKKVRSIKRFTRTSMRIAAAFLLCVAGWLLYRQLSPQATAKQTISSTLPVKAAQQEITLSNTTGAPIQYTLEDRSVVILSNNSEVKYTQPFDAHKRDLQLAGEATFKVTKDKNRPFTVFAKGFSTTALGTTFIIKAYTTDKTASIKLLTGKVVVKNLHQSNNDIYLVPGEQCSFDYAAVNLTRLVPKQPQATPVPDKLSATPAGSIEETADQIIFRNTNLVEVMHKLSEVYHTPITYDTTAIHNKKFIGNIARERTLEDVLNTIALLNDLQLTRKDGAFIITSN